VSRSPKIEKKIRDLLAQLEERSRRGPGLYPVHDAGDFFRLAVLHLNIESTPSDSLADWEPADLQDLANALETLIRQPAAASVWVNRILLLQGGAELTGLPRNIRREDAGSSAGHLAALLQRGHPLTTRTRAL
jgi:hypothetical protein